MRLSPKLLARYCDWKQPGKTKWRSNMTSCTVHHPLKPFEKEEARWMYMKENVKECDKQWVQVPEIYVFATAAENDEENRQISAQVFICEQANDWYCRLASSILGLPGSTWNYDRNRLLIRISPINGVVQEIILTSLPPGLLYQSHCQALAGHQGERRV